MSAGLTLTIIVSYFGVIYLIAYFSGRTANAQAFYLAGRKAPWLLVSYGMLGVAISGITFISVPGEVINTQFSYLQLVLGYTIGLLIVAFVFVPVYYKQQVVSIYAYLENRFGFFSHKIGATFFMIAHLLAASFRLFLMAYVLQLMIFDDIGIPFSITVAVTIALIWFYTFKGGIQTVLFTDVLQTSFLLLAVVLTLASISDGLGLSFKELYADVWHGEHAQIFFWEWNDPKNFFKLVVTGILLTVMSNGLDQAIMQKHLACANISDAQKNLILLSVAVFLVNILFVFLGGALLLFATENSISLPSQSDEIYPLLAVEHLGVVASATFVIGIAAAAYSSADTSLTGLTTAFCVDFLGYQKTKQDNPRIRHRVHLGFSIMIFICIMAFRLINDQSVISVFITVSGYAYGPLLGLFTFGFLTKRVVKDEFVPLLCVIAPLCAFILSRYSTQWFSGYQLGYEIIVVNAAITFFGLFLLSNKNRVVHD
ncbi:MAG: sodium:solute symporter [Saprospiraceae bacterium]|nr:sodium:solute symporter [Saprospiraceae bacterium]